MRQFVLALAACCLAVPGTAQVQPGELLVNTRNPDALEHYLADGTLAGSVPLAGRPGYGAAILPDGTWIGTRFKPTSGLILYDPVTDVVVLDVDTPSVSFPGDAEARSDGTIVVADFFNGALAHFDTSGNLLNTWNIPGASWTAWLYIDEFDEMWCTDLCTRVVYHLDANGNLVGTIPLSVAMKDLVVAPDQTLWMVTANCSGTLFHYQKDGTLIETVQTGIACAFSLAITPEGSLWVSDGDAGGIHRFDLAGNPLGSFPLASGGSSFTLSTLVRGNIGVNYCQANPNSTGLSGRLIGTGSDEVVDNDVIFLAVDLPPGEPGFLINSPNQTFIANPGGSAGNLCVGPKFGRHLADAASSGSAGAIVVPIDLTAVPQSSGGPHAMLPGETWNFQLWFRDRLTSNLTDAVEILFK